MVLEPVSAGTSHVNLPSGGHLNLYLSVPEVPQGIKQPTWRSWVRRRLGHLWEVRLQEKREWKGEGTSLEKKDKSGFQSWLGREGFLVPRSYFPPSVNLYSRITFLPNFSRMSTYISTYKRTYVFSTAARDDTHGL